jgi:CRP-like cAMP-binding protein
MARRSRSAAHHASTRSAVPPVNRANRNHLLAAVPADEYARLLPSLELVAVDVKQLLHKIGDPIEYVYFPGGGFVSDLAALEDGTLVEVATIGREGLVGTDAVLDGGFMSSTAMVQAEMDICYRMHANAFREAMARGGMFREFVTHFAHALFAMVKQYTACNAVHKVEQRLARWLLLAEDRVGTQEFALTQEFLAMMLGVSRPAVTVVAGTLQKAGLINYRRGRVTIIDREALENASCECYRVTTTLLQHIGRRHHGPRRSH